MSYYGNSSGGFGYGGSQHQQQQPQGPYGAYNQQPPPQQTGVFQQPSQFQQPGQFQQQNQNHPNHLQNQHQQQLQPTNFWNPQMAASVMGAVGAAAASGTVSSDTIMDLGGQVWRSGTARMVPGLESGMQYLRLYFAVDNRYVKRKLGKILFPFLSKNWSRQTESNGPDLRTQYALPHSDENAPDLYLPCMSMITYVLLCAICYGTAGKFDPEVLPDVTTWCVATQLLEVLVIRVGFYTMEVPVPILDLLSYTGYKYVGLCLNMLAGIVLGTIIGFGHRLYYLFFLWTASAASYFMLKTMANNIPLKVAETGPKREVMVFAFAGSQFATMWFVSQTKFLN